MRDDYKVNVPEGTSGAWSVRRITVTEEQSSFDRLRAVINGGARYVPAGDYTQLLRGGTIVMSDTPDEIRDHMGFIHRASGRVLIGGLGLGVVLQALLRKPDITHVTVIEKSPDVIKLVAPSYKDPRVEVIQADILEWKPPPSAIWDCSWFDIWDFICSDNLEQMARLKRRFARRVKVSQGAWCEGACRRQKRYDAHDDRIYKRLAAAMRPGTNS
jgi:hypothetical protein